MVGNNFFNTYVFQFRHGGDFSIQMMSLSEAYIVVTARSDRVAIEQVKQSGYTDLGVMEYRLPGMSGVDVMKKSRMLPL